MTLGSPDICVAVLDGLVDQSHECFKGAALTRLPSLVQGEAISDGSMSSHGTHVTSIIFGQPDSSVVGLAPRCKGVIIPVFSDRHHSISQLDLARGIEQAVNAGAHIINISGGQVTDFGEAEGWLKNAVRLCQEKNVLLIAAAGNDGCNCLHVPAALPAVLAVGAMDASGTPLDFSNWGEAYQSQGILAPGDNILGAKPGGGTQRLSGTSFATPIVSGVAALLLSLHRQRGYPPDPQRVRQVLLQTALPCGTGVPEGAQRCLAGKLNITGAITLLIGGKNMANEPKAIETVETSGCGCGGGLTHTSDVPIAGRIAAEGEEVQPDWPIAASVNGFAVTQSDASHLEAISAQGRSVGAVVSAGVGVVDDVPIPTNGVQVVPQQSSFTQPSRQTTMSNSSSSANFVTPSEASSELASEQFVYVIGTLGYDFGSEARRDTFKQLMPPQPVLGQSSEVSVPPNPYDPRQMVAWLGQELSEARALIWTLNMELTPVYAIEPTGSFASEAYSELVKLLDAQTRFTSDEEYVERVSLPGVLTGKTVKLFSGQVVPVVRLLTKRGLYGWTTTRLINEVLRVMQTLPAPLATATGEPPTEQEIRDALESFLNRVYYDLRNLGTTSQDRALNHSVTDTVSSVTSFGQALREGKQLDSISVEKSPFCRLDSDCWDVKLKFFDPTNNRMAKRIFRYTVDVSDVNPVSVGAVKTWTQAY